MLSTAKAVTIFVVVAWATFLTGCAIVYSDESNGTLHVWGVGHIAMRATPVNEGTKGIVRGVSLCGLGAGVWNHDPFVSLGWERNQSVEIVDSNTSIQIDQAGGDLLNIRVGSQPRPTTRREGGQ